MPYFVKSRGPEVLNRGPFETYREANAKRDELEQEPLYSGQEMYVEYVPYVEPERRPPLGRRKHRSRGRSGSRVSGRSSSSGGSSTRAVRRKKRRTRRAGRRR
jgi:hypothetical protein